MYLKSIRAQGFKSFADKLDLEINPGITGIVGPNGSGKSNIVDAVRWVLGEQSVRSLRGQNNMTDCIFSGSESREAQKRAMVALVFDNSDHYLHSDFKEVEIKRIVYSTGENEYYINNSRVRLKDITDMFIDSGAGANAFNIISQGNVTDIVNSKSSDRRVIFESAAGVLKYKKRKEESLKKLERTEENLMRIKLVIDELSKTVLPLKEQSVVAKKYLDIKGELESIDVALIAKDITDLNLEYSKVSEEVKALKEKLITLKDNVGDTRLEKLRLRNIELEEVVNKKKEELLKITEDISNLNGEKKLTLERKKYEASKEVIDDNLIKLKESELNVNKNITVLEREILDIEASVNDQREKSEEVKNKLLVIKVKKSTSSNALMEANKAKFLLENKIEILENNILSAEAAPVSVRNILNNPRIHGVHNTIGKLLDIPEKYVIATDIALGASSNYLVVDDDNVALSAIDFLKERKLGRATFYPLNVIKSKYVSSDIINDIRNINGYIGVLSDLVRYDKKYKNIVENRLGQVIVVDNERTLNIIGKLINYKYVVVSLDGEILHVGGSITGGTSKKNSMLNEKNELNKLKNDLQKLDIKIKELTEEVNNLSEDTLELEERENVLNKYIVLLNEELFNKRTNLSRLNEEHKSILSELDGINDLKSNKLDEHLVNLMESINNLVKSKEIIEKDIKVISKEKIEVNDEINILDKKLRDNNSSYNLVNNELKNKEVVSGKLEVKLDNLLEELNNSYNLTYESACGNYNLEMDADIAREHVKNLKKELASLGNVNVGAIDEYERISKRYEFLNSQKYDLESASGELKDIIREMDDIMIDKFKNSFDSISKEFSKIFKMMFKGGKGELSLSNPDDLLNTGIDILAIPPGKKINSPLSLSGGEKALTAICLLFAMLEVKPSPFVILDEAEAALDEVNVDMFGKYLSEEKSRSQFIVITHKKRMMEYADSLYGITMQESGVSKIVSAKLES
ncbi:chromosome partition protein Smc [Firmicutes bacterium CAG:460]|nr:chromosome partition protein Smc [Firmicutes bacterium CAG:460]